MKRSVVLHGPSTLTVSLPSKWIKKYGVKKGDEIDVLEEEERLIICAEVSSKECKKAQVDMGDIDKKTCRWILSILYKQGYEEISIRYNTPKTADIIGEVVRNQIMGFIVTEEHKNSCLLKCVSKELKGEFNKSERRAFLVTLSLAEKSFELINKGEYSQLKDLYQLEMSNNQLTNFCERLLNKDLIGEEGTSFKYIILWQLEKIADEFVEIINLLIENPFKIDASVLKLYEETKELLREYYDNYYKKELRKLKDIYDKEKEITKFVKEKVKAKNSATVLLVSHLLHIISKIAEMIPSTIAANKAFEDGTTIQKRG